MAIYLSARTPEHSSIARGPLPPPPRRLTLHCMDAFDQDTAILRSMTPARKLAVMRSLIRQAYVLKAAAIRARWPDLPETEVHARTRALVAGDRS